MISGTKVIAPLCLGIAPLVAHAEQKPEKIAITPTSARAAVIIRAADVPLSGAYKTSYRIGLQIYDPAAKTMRGGPFGGNATLAAQPKFFADGYLVTDLVPGTYVVRDFSRQDFWALCFNDDSRQFTVRAGEVVYLGAFDAPRYVAELQRQAMVSGQLTTKGKPVHFFDGVPAPHFDQSAEDLAAVGAMMKRRMPLTTVVPQLAALEPARFGTGHDLFGLDRICGGYYTQRAK